MFQASLFLFALLFLAVEGGRKKWNSYGNFHPSTFVDYNDDVTPLLQSQDENLKDVAPQVIVLDSIPEPDNFVWPSFKELAYRNSKTAHIFNLQAAYIISDGLSYGCRNKDGSAVNSDMCNKHCTHKGRYCPALLPDLLEQRTKTHGRLLIFEIVRRLCFGSVLEGTYANVDWFEYLESFDEQKCEESSDMAECSNQIIEGLGMDGNQTQEMGKCIAEADKDTDNTNPMLEQQLKLLKSIDYSWETLPTVKINNDTYHAGSGGFVFMSYKVTEAWCEHFPTDVVSKNTTVGVEHITKPITCDFCVGCNYVARCLWLNHCDGHKFDVDTFRNPKAETPLQEIEEDVEEVTEDIFKVAIALVVGVVLGGGIVLGVLAIQAQRKRQQAITEMTKTMPMEGRFNDEDNSPGGMEMTMPGKIPGKDVFTKFRDNEGDDSKPLPEVM